MLGVVVAVVSPIGDLSESLVKRGLGLKDMGRILPGHGGLVDRIDGLLFVLPATYYLVKAVPSGVSPSGAGRRPAGPRGPRAGARWHADLGVLGRRRAKRWAHGR